jgi:hypothetical protein
MQVASRTTARNDTRCTTQKVSREFSVMNQFHSECKFSGVVFSKKAEVNGARAAAFPQYIGREQARLA